MGADSASAAHNEVGEIVVRIAELDIDPAHRPGFLSAVRAEMEEAVRVEPGVLAIYAVADRDDPDHLRFFEIYASHAAYEAHLASPHFRKYVETTGSMILARELIETVPLQLSSKTI